MKSESKLAHLQSRYELWRGAALPLKNDSISTGYKGLDDTLQIGGWPSAGLLELLTDRPGMQELSLLMPAIAQHLQKEQRIAFIGLPYLLSPIALRRFGISPQQVWCIHSQRLEEQLWATQQLLKSGHCLMVIGWQLRQRVSAAQLRRLQVAAKDGKSCGVILRNSHYAEEASPASMRLCLKSGSRKGVTLTILKQPGSFAGQCVEIPNQLATKQQLQRHDLPVHIPDQYQIASKQKPVNQKTALLPNLEEGDSIHAPNLVSSLSIHGDQETTQQSTMRIHHE